MSNPRAKLFFVFVCVFFFVFFGNGNHPFKKLPPDSPAKDRKRGGPKGRRGVPGKGGSGNPREAIAPLLPFEADVG